MPSAQCSTATTWCALCCSSCDEKRILCVALIVDELVGQFSGGLVSLSLYCTKLLSSYLHASMTR